MPRALTARVDLNLFAGGGGLACGLSSAGFGPFDLFELDRWARATLEFNTTSLSPTICGRVAGIDVRTTSWAAWSGRVRLLAGGVPCQPFSLGGAHRAEKDDRNLFPDTLKAIRETHPLAVLLENVAGLRRPAFHPYFQYVIRQLRRPSLGPLNDEAWTVHDQRLARLDLGQDSEEYRVTWSLENAADFGVPQQRKRILVAAIRADVAPAFRFPPPSHSRDALIDRLGSGAAENPSSSESLPFDESSRSASEARSAWVTVREALRDLPSPSAQPESSSFNHWRIAGARSYKGHSGSQMDWPAKTIKAGVHGVPGGENMLITDTGELRYFTLREAARLQTFPDEHVFSGARSSVVRQIGNAVPCKLSEAVGTALAEHLADSASSRSEHGGPRNHG